ncbi:hypothetical protein AYL99_11816 [Fonsecaea erecta]|uniref:Uncharacterized protein n=1 Tax=Fonsecaea erecta TaxID=1367422 RepID=A0A178Z3C5_9EURO|nr:hypothetical protein AYL99_11816 [Fonsecaea erecta]OAP53936.1 hypothetical protein AYL99_11816 [Fonsecaea erecta]
MKVVFVVTSMFVILLATVSTVVCSVQVSNPALSVIALYSENADVLLHPCMEQDLNLKSLVFVPVLGGIHMSSVLSQNGLVLLDLWVRSEPGLLVALVEGDVTPMSVVGIEYDQDHDHRDRVAVQHRHRRRRGLEYVFTPHGNIMSDIEEIDRLIDFGISSSTTSRGGDDNEGEVGIGRSNVVTELTEAIELEIERLKADGPAERHRNVARLPDPDALRHTKSPAFGLRRTNTDTTKDEDTESFSTVSRTKSESSSRIRDMEASSYMNRSPNAAVFSISSPALFKTNSATANRGYSNKMTLWGTIFTSLMVACMTKYIQVTGESGHIIDEVPLMKVYNAIVPELYSRIKFGELPAVQSHEAKLLS